ncbi:hypothetical protein AB0I53_48600 [Saccharopolyspora sp. NPDC050389]|uniref:hypothetical protein n=1 Tax=Saccharopolyspora sp. NPDC050389 TaxID=3155516 RepID=UPI00340F6A3A
MPHSLWLGVVPADRPARSRAPELGAELERGFHDLCADAKAALGIARGEAGAGAALERRAG